MESVRFLLGGVLPYVAVVVFVVAMIRRISQWRRLAAPPMTLFPAPETEGEARINTLKEAVFFRSLFKGDRVLWGFAWAFHVVLLLIFVGHLRVFTNVDAKDLNGIIRAIDVDGHPVNDTFDLLRGVAERCHLLANE